MAERYATIYESELSAPDCHGNRQAACESTFFLIGPAAPSFDEIGIMARHQQIVALEVDFLDDLKWLASRGRVTGNVIVLWLGVQKIIRYDLMPPDRPLAERIIQTEQLIVGIDEVDGG